MKSFATIAQHQAWLERVKQHQAEDEAEDRAEVAREATLPSPHPVAEALLVGLYKLAGKTAIGRLLFYGADPEATARHRVRYGREFSPEEAAIRARRAARDEAARREFGIS